MSRNDTGPYNRRQLNPMTDSALRAVRDRQQYETFRYSSPSTGDVVFMGILAQSPIRPSITAQTSDACAHPVELNGRFFPGRSFYVQQPSVSELHDLVA